MPSSAPPSILNLFYEKKIQTTRTQFTLLEQNPFFFFQISNVLVAFDKIISIMKYSFWKMQRCSFFSFSNTVYHFYNRPRPGSSKRCISPLMGLCPMLEADKYSFNEKVRCSFKNSFKQQRIFRYEEWSK